MTITIDETGSYTLEAFMELLDELKVKVKKLYDTNETLIVEFKAEIN